MRIEMLKKTSPKESLVGIGTIPKVTLEGSSVMNPSSSL